MNPVAFYACPTCVAEAGVPCLPAGAESQVPLYHYTRVQLALTALEAELHADTIGDREKAAKRLGAKIDLGFSEIIKALYELKSFEPGMRFVTTARLIAKTYPAGDVPAGHDPDDREIARFLQMRRRRAAVEHVARLGMGDKFDAMLDALIAEAGGTR